MKNRFKIDINFYVSGRYPVALYIRRGWCWRHVESFETVEQAAAAFNRIGYTDLPIYLPRGNDL